MSSQSNIERLFRLRKPLVKRAKVDKGDDSKRPAESAEPATLSPLPSVSKRRLPRCNASPKPVARTVKVSPRTPRRSVKQSPKLCTPSPRRSLRTNTRVKKTPKVTRRVKDSPKSVRQATKESPKVVAQPVKESPKPVDTSAEGDVITPRPVSRAPTRKRASIQLKLSLKRPRTDPPVPTVKSPSTPSTPKTPVAVKRSPYTGFTMPVSAAIPLPLVFDDDDDGIDDDDEICEIRNDRRILPGNDAYLESVVGLFTENPISQ